MKKFFVFLPGRTLEIEAAKTTTDYSGGNATFIRFLDQADGTLAQFAWSSVTGWVEASAEVKPGDVKA